MQARFEYLFQRYIQREATISEKQELYTAIDSGRYDQQLRQLLDEAAEQGTVHELSEDYFLPGAAERMLSVIFTSTAAKPPIYSSKIWLRVAISIAASLLFFIGLYFYLQQQNQPVSGALVTTDIAPGTNGATLTLADGRRIRLTAHSDGELAQEAGLTIRKTADGQLIYELADQATKLPTAQEALSNSLSTAAGEMYQVRLPDGTRVYLNASSRLTYCPTLVQQGKRSVSLSGEAYFEVAKDKQHPFIVKTRGQEVEVLGTHFNIAAYTDESGVSTTLLEGQVRIHPSIASVTDQVLRPGQQATLTDRALTVTEVRAADAITWTKGYFLFNDEPLESIMRKVARWYNVEVEYRTGAPLQMKFNGTVSRYAHVSQVLRKLELTNAVRFHIEKQKIIVER